MDKRERAELVNKGMTVLRATVSQKKSCYIICSATRNCGWKPFGSSWFSKWEEANNKIDDLVVRNPDKYIKG